MISKSLSLGLVVLTSLLHAVSPAIGEQVDAAESDGLPLLLQTPDLMTVAPALDAPTGPERAKLFLEIGAAWYAAGDTARANRALRYAHALDPSIAATVASAPEQVDDPARTFVADLNLAERRARYAKTSKLKAAGRSLIVPGWGQMYRGHKRRGWIAFGLTAAAGAYLVKAASDYSSARDAYDATTVAELDLDALGGTGEMSRPFETRYAAYQSKASTANKAAMALVAIWGAAVLDNLVIGPNRFELTWEVGR